MFSSKSSAIILVGLFVLVALCELGQTGNSCSRHTCRPPHCRCPGHSIPGNLRPEKVPQMVLLTFDDAVNWDNWDYYLRLFPPNGRRKNPNGCPQEATYFVSNNFTDYCMVRKLHARGMEIADHSVTHHLPRLWWTNANADEIGEEILGQRRNLATKAHVPENEIRGWRSPFLQPAGDDLYSVLFHNNFTYDATMTYSFPKNLYSPVLWPFTMDFGYTLVCNIARCPKKSYPGFWVVPVVVVMDYREQKPCAYVDHCDNMPQDTNEAYQYLWKNFLRNYRSNRAPVYLNLHSPWLSNPHYLDAMDQFLEKMSQMDDVFVTTVHKSIQWQMDPTPIEQIHNFKPWSCPGYQPNQEDRKICSFTFRPKGKVELRHEMPNALSDKRQQNYEKLRKEQIKTHGPSSSTHLKQHDKKVSDDANDDKSKSGDWSSSHDHDHDEDDRSLHDHHHHSNHHHKAHKPWFLRNSSTSCFVDRSYSCYFLTMLLGIILSYYYHYR